MQSGLSEILLQQISIIPPKAPMLKPIEDNGDDIPLLELDPESHLENSFSDSDTESDLTEECSSPKYNQAGYLKHNLRSPYNVKTKYSWKKFKRDTEVKSPMKCRKWDKFGIEKNCMSMFDLTEELV